MKRRNTVSILIICLSLMTGLGQSVAASDANETEELISRYRKETKCENVSVVVYKDSKAAYYGDNESLYQIGSMTKAFTALAAQKLICEGMIDEDGLVSDYIPGFEAYYGSAKVDITVRDLLEQRSGYTNNENDYPGATEAMTLSEWAKIISGRELKSRPGTAYAYSNVNYNLLGLIIENVSKMPYREYMEQEILIPLGLADTSAGMPSTGKIVEGTRPGYRHVYDFPLTVREAAVPAGYFYSNTHDMGRWIQIWTGSCDIPESFREPLSKVKDSLHNEGDYYCGWELFANGIVGHSGGTPNYSSRIVFDEINRTGVCVLANLNVAATTDSLCNSICDIISGRHPSGLGIDIWTIFDKIFTGVTLVAMGLLPVTLMIKRRSVLLATGVVLAVLLASVIITLPVIFGAGMRQIMFTWAPWSLTGGLVAVAANIVAITVKLLKKKHNENHNKAGKRQTSYGHDRIPGI